MLTFHIHQVLIVWLVLGQKVHDEGEIVVGMGLATAPIVKNSVNIIGGTFGISCSNSKSSMSQGFHRGIYSFSEGTSAQDQHHHDQQQQQPHHIAQQSRRDKLRVQSGFDPPLVPIVHQEEVVGGGIYEAATGSSNMLSEMFNFNTVMVQGGVVGGPSASELLASQMQAGGYHLPPSRAPLTGFGPTGDSTWYNNTTTTKGGSGGQVINLGGNSMVDHMKVAPQLNAHDSVTAMQLFLMDPAQSHDPRSPSPPPPPPQALFGVVGSTHQHHHQGLSLSLSSSLQTAANQDHLRLRDGALYFNNNDNNNNDSSSSNIPLLQGEQSQGHHMGYGVVNVLRNSKYSRAAQELLEEFCSVGREQFKRTSRNQQYGSSSSNPNPNNPNSASTSANAGAGSSSSSKDVPSLPPADRFEHQRKKSKLLSMLDEVDRRYNYYCDQMQMVVNSFDSVMGFGAATPYTALARKAMSRHFRCLKDAIAEQLKRTCELLGEKEVGSSSGITRGETPRLRLLDQSLRQQRAFHQMGMLEQEAWRPQRGLPERSVTILRAWLFEHFLHPYPSDADKHLLARQTGLSRNQVSNWFINARVRLWKPMIEEMYQQEAKEQAEAEAGNNRDDDVNNQQTPQSPTNQVQVQMQDQQRLETDAQLERFPGSTSIASAHDVTSIPILHMIADTPELCGPHDDLYREYEAAGLGPAARMRLGTTGDVSLTLGLRHAGGNNAPEKNRPFTIRDFGG